MSNQPTQDDIDHAIQAARSWVDGQGIQRRQMERLRLVASEAFEALRLVFPEFRGPLRVTQEDDPQSWYQVSKYQADA